MSTGRDSGPAQQASRRGEVEAAVLAVDPGVVKDLARARTSARLDGRTVEAVGQIAFVVPTEVIGAVLGIDDDDAQLVADVAAMVRVISLSRLSSGCS